MAKLIIELLGKQGCILDRHLINEPIVKIGRSYKNGVILSDPFVSPEHITISQDEHGWRVEDLSSKNGLFKKYDPTSHEQLLLRSGDEICIGKTHLRILSPDHPVPPATEMASTVPPKKVSASYSLQATLFFCLCFFFASHYLNNAEEGGMEKLLAKTLLVMPIALLWAGAWAFLGKVVNQRHFFGFQLQMTMVFLVAVLLLDVALGYVEYNANNAAVAMGIKIICFGLLTEYALSKHLFVSTALDRGKVRKVSGAIVCGLIGGTLFVYYAITSDFDPNPRYSLTLKPPLVKVSSSLSVGDFFKDNQVLFKKLSGK